MTVSAEKILRVCPVPLASEYQNSAFFTHGLLVTHAKAYKDGTLQEYCDFEKITPIKPLETEDLLLRMKHQPLPVVFMLASYVWNHELNLAFARRARLLIPDALIVIGGPNIPRVEKPCSRFMNINHCIDVAVQGEGEMTLSVLLETICDYLNRGGEKIRQCDLSGVNGLTFRNRSMKPVRTADRERIKHMDSIPSPYLTGEFEHLSAMPPVVVMETSRGCPFGCTFCDWGGATLSKIHRFDTQRVIEEIEYLAKRKIHTVLLADANFGTFDSDIALAEKFVEMKGLYGFPVHVAQFLAKNSPERVGKIVKILNEAQMMPDAVASLQSTDPVVLKNIKRANIKESAYEDMIVVFHEAKMTPSTDILVGLPGQTYDSFKKDLQFSFDRHLLVRCFPVRVLPNSPMADEAYMKEHGLVVDQDGYVIYGNTFSQQDCQRMLALRAATNLFSDEKILYYLLLYLQAEHGVLAVDVIDKLISLPQEQARRFPMLFWVKENMLCGETQWAGAVSLAWKKDAEYFFSNAMALFNDVREVLQGNFSVELNRQEYEALANLQVDLLAWPRQKVAPHVLCADYDFAGYFAQFAPSLRPVLSREGREFRSLATFCRASYLDVKEQEIFKRKNFGFLKQGFYGITWTLDAGLLV